MQIQARLQIQIQNTNEHLNIVEKIGLLPFEISLARLWHNFPSDSHCIRNCVPLLVCQSHPFESVQLHAQALDPITMPPSTQQRAAVSSITVLAAIVHGDIEVSFALIGLQHNKTAKEFIAKELIGP